MKHRAFAIALAAIVGFFAAHAKADERDDAERALEKAIGASDKDRAKDALAAAAKPGDLRAAKTLLTHALKLRGFGVHEELLDAIKAIQDEAGVKELAEASKKNPSADLRYLLVEGLARQGSPIAAKAVLDGLDDKVPEVATIAARSARHLATPDTIERLIARLERAESKATDAVIAREVTGALCSLTGENLSFALEWRIWWTQKKDGWKPRGQGDGESAKKSDGGGDAKKGDGAGGDEGDGERHGGGQTVAGRLKRDRPEDWHTIERLREDDVIVVFGVRDKISDVLTAIGVRHKRIQPADLKTTKLDPRSVLVLNCNATHDPYGEIEWTQIREFVDHGGYLFTSDWELSFTLQKVFPGSIEQDKKTDEKPFVVSILPAAPKHPFMRDVFPMTTWDATAFTWHIDERSELIKVVSPDVTVLVESPDLKKSHGNGAVAVTFRWHDGHVVGKEPTGPKKQATGSGAKPTAPHEPPGGCVLHVMSHFEKQRDANAGDHFALQQLLLNFFLEKQHAKNAAAN